jgi:hypothetical protein
VGERSLARKSRLGYRMDRYYYRHGVDRIFKKKNLSKEFLYFR